MDIFKTIKSKNNGKFSVKYSSKVNKTKLSFESEELASLEDATNFANDPKNEIKVLSQFSEIVGMVGSC